MTLKEQQRAWNARYYRKHRSILYPRILQRDLKNRPNKLARQRRTARRARVALSDGYVRWRLSRGTSVKMSEWPKALVSLKRTQLQGIRLCRNLKTSKNSATNS